MFSARTGGEPVRLQIYQWEEAVNGEWVDSEQLPEEIQMNSMLITYQTGKGSHHLSSYLLKPKRPWNIWQIRKYEGMQGLHWYSWSQIYVWAIWVGHDQTFFGDSDLEIQYEYHSTVNDFVPSMMWQKKQEVKNKNIKYKKPSHPCPFCCTAQAQLKCHILTKYNTEPFVIPILTMNPSNENRHIDMLRQQAIRNHMALLKAGEKSLCESKSAGQHEDLPVMCSGCEGSWPENSRLITNLFVQLLVLN